jgi:regulator of CtrA degradation
MTTRLMQLASWLLLHRAVKEGEMSLAQANREKVKVKLTAADPAAKEVLERLPAKLQDLVERSMGLQTRIRRLDSTMHAPQPPTMAGSPLVSQLDRLKAAFENPRR